MSSSSTKGQRPKPDKPEYPSGTSALLIATGLCMAVICSNLDRSIISVATPKITKEFDSLDDVGWYGSAYLLTSCCSQLMFGKLYVFYDIKFLFLGSLSLFEVGSILCAAARSSTCLIVGRAVAGLGATGISTGALLIISHTIPVSKRPVYTAMIGASMGVTLVVAPFLGGVFTDKVTWRWCFWINLPLGGLTLFTTFFFVKLPKNSNEKGPATFRELLGKLDIYGNFILLPGLVCLLLALQWGGSTYSWHSWRCILLLCLFGVSAVVWAVIQRYGGEASTVPIRLLRIRSIVSSTWFATCLFAMLFCQSYYFPIWFQAIRGDSAFKAGINMLAVTAAMTVSFPVSGILTTKIGSYVPGMIVGSVLAAVASGLSIRFGTDTSIVYWAATLVVSGIGFGLGGQQCMMVPQTILKGGDISLGTSIIMFGETLSGTVFLSVAENIFQTALIKQLRARVPDVDPAVIISNGATSLTSTFGDVYDTETLQQVLLSYSEGLKPVWILTTVLGSLSILGAVGTEWVNLKKIGEEEEKEKGQKADGGVRADDGRAV